MSLFQEPISEHVWNIKYRYRQEQKELDQSIHDTWQRVSKAAASVEKKPQQPDMQKQFYSILENFQFLPGGRILAGAGTKHDVTLFNCFVMPIQHDSLAGIFDALKEAALTLQQGGGVGYDFSVLRPSGASVPHVGAVASGPVSFMRIWDAMCATMVSTGARRGAMMGVMRCDHPDIEEFIAAKADAHELRHFNLSVLVTDAFMHAVHQNLSWNLVFPQTSKKRVKQLKARELWDKIIKSAYDYAEPGVLFEDTINRNNNLWYREKITATNPCGEIPLPAYGACNLGSLNLTQFVIKPFTERAEIDWQKLENVTRIATRFLDNIIDVSRYPLKQQMDEAAGTRRIGLGITGLADCFVMMGVQYGDEKSIILASQLMKRIAEVTWRTSIELAKERGAFPQFDKSSYLQGEFVKRQADDIRLDIEKYGIRHSHHNTIAPAGTISLLANAVSNGIEPIFKERYERMLRLPSGKLQAFTVNNYSIRQWQKMVAKELLPPAWIDSDRLLPEQHLQMQAALQPYIDNAISKTINIPADFPFEKLSDVYTKAHQLGLKGCTIYRPNEITGSVMNAINESESVDRCCQA